MTEGENVIPFKCPQCGGELLKTTSEPQSASHLGSTAICAGCGRKFTEDDIRTQAKKIAEDLIRDTIRKRRR